MQRLALAIIVVVVGSSPSWAQNDPPSRSVLTRHTATAGPTRLAELPVDFYSTNRSGCCNEQHAFASHEIASSASRASNVSIEGGYESIPTCGCDAMAACGCDAGPTGGCCDRCCCPLLPALAADVKCFLDRLFCCRRSYCDVSCCDMGPSCGCDRGMPVIGPAEDDLDLAPPPVPSLSGPRAAQRRIQRARSQTPRVRPEDLQARAVKATPAPREIQRDHSSLTRTTPARPLNQTAGSAADLIQNNSASVRQAAGQQQATRFSPNPLR